MAIFSEFQLIIRSKTVLVQSQLSQYSYWPQRAPDLSEATPMIYHCVINADITQVVEGLGAGGIVPQRLFVELCSLFMVLFDKHGVTLVDKCRWVVAVGVHGEISIPVCLIIVLLLLEGKGQWEASIASRMVQIIVAVIQASLNPDDLVENNLNSKHSLC